MTAPAITATGNFSHLVTPVYSAVSLPLAEGVTGALVVVLPNKKSNMSTIEEQMLGGSGAEIETLLDHVRKSTFVPMTVTLPRLSIQVHFSIC